MAVWLALGGLLAGVILVCPLRYAMGITATALPMAGTAVMMLGGEPVVLPLLTSTAFVARHAFSLLLPAERERCLGLIGKDGLFLSWGLLCVASAFVYPRLFEGRAYVIDQLGVLGPLGPWSTSLVQVAYLVLALWVFIAMRHAVDRAGMTPVLVALIVQAALFGGLGLIQALAGLGGVSIETGWVVNNEGYSLLTQLDFGGFARVTSVFVEASSYAHWAIGPLAFFYALYVNRLLPLVSISLAGVLALTLLLSTSSTAYAGLLGLAAISVLHALLDQNVARRERSLAVLGLAGLTGGVVVAIALSAQGGFWGDLRGMIEEATVRKQYSGSAIERGMWARIAFEAGLDTWLLGAGYGVVRASGLFVTMFGTIGVPGLVLFAASVATMAASAFRPARTGEDAVAAGCAFAIGAGLIAAAVSGSEIGLFSMFWVFAAIASGRPSPNPGVGFTDLRTRHGMG